MKKLYFLLISLLIINIAKAQWTQLGGSFTNPGYESGRTIAFSKNGNVVAEIGGYMANTYIRQYSNGTWIQKGNSISYGGSDDYEHLLDINDDGNIAATSGVIYNGSYNTVIVKVYEYIVNNWVQIGNNIDIGIPEDDKYGSISLSSDGYTIAIGSMGNDDNGTDAGQVRVYNYNNGSWIQKGNEINGEDSLDYSGESVSLSYDGNVIAISSTKNDGVGKNSGHVRVFEFNDTIWTQIGNDIDGKDSLEYLGSSVCLNADGTTVAIACLHTFGTIVPIAYRGYRVYKLIEGGWLQMGNDDILPTHIGTVKLSSDGLIIAYGSKPYSGYANSRIIIRAYNNSEWIQIGQEINSIPEDFFIDEFALGLSADGARVAIGAPQSNYLGFPEVASGSIRVYNNSSVDVNEIEKENDVSIFPNPTNGKITIKANDIENIEIINFQGKQIYTGKEINIDLSKQPKGIYIIKAITDNQIIIRKLIKQ